MSKKRFILGVAGALLAGGAALLYNAGRDAGPAFIDPSDDMLVVKGKAIYANNCAACHGEALQGQPNWRERLPNGRLPAPPHAKTGHPWHQPGALRFDMGKNGLVAGNTAARGYESDMPAYAGILTDEEIVAVLDYINSDWPPRVLQAQKEVTLQRRD